MTAIKHTLQRKVFLPSEERLVAVVHVTKHGKKKKPSFLCAAVTTEKPVQPLVYQVKKSERGESYKKKASWGLRELKVLDAKDPHRDIAEFDLQFDKVYKWNASSIQEKKAFIQCLWRLSQRYLVQKPEFINVPSELLEDQSHVIEADKIAQVDDMALVTEGDYHALSQKEESDLETLMSHCDHAISNAEAFADQLSQDLSVLDGANIHSIMGSEEQVLQLMVLLDDGLQEAMNIEEKLDKYDHKLQSVKDLMEMMKDKDMLHQIKNRNHGKLLEDLDDLVSSLDLDHTHMKALLDGDLSTPKGIYECTSAAEALQKCMAAEIHAAYSRMAAVQEQQRRFTKLKATFAKRLSHHLNNLFIHQGNEMGETLSRYATDLKLPQHHSSHRDLTPYAELMLWMKQTDSNVFNKLAKVYTSSLNKLYDLQVKEFMETAKMKLASRTTERGKAGGPRLPGEGSSSSLNKPFDTRSLKSASMSTLGDSDSQHGSDPDILGRTKFDQMFDHVLSELEPVCLAEQDFCVKFFHLSVEPQTAESMLGEQPKHEQEHEEDGGPWVPRKPTPQEAYIENLGAGLLRKQSSIVQRQISEEVRLMMTELFPSLEAELNGFITYGDKLDNFNSMYMLVRMSQHVINAQDTGSFLSKTFAGCLIQIKRNFDKFIQHQIRSIEETRVTKKTKCGIIPFVSNFEDFAHQAESIFKNSDRRTDLEKAYTRLVRTIFEQIARIAAEHPKSPKDVIMFENFHRMSATLSHLKISCLEGEKKEAKQKYIDHQHAYVTSYLGRPMEKLNNFFEGIESRVKAGVKEEEVGYQLAYNKQELRKVIKEYPGKEVKKGLDHLYRKLNKHTSDEENLLQVVWHTMQDEFLKQYAHFEDLIRKCYPDSQVTLEFTIDDLLQYFSDIAQSH